MCGLHISELVKTIYAILCKCSAHFRANCLLLVSCIYGGISAGNVENWIETDAFKGWKTVTFSTTFTVYSIYKKMKFFFKLYAKWDNFICRIKKCMHNWIWMLDSMNEPNSIICRVEMEGSREPVWRKRSTSNIKCTLYNAGKKHVTTFSFKKI